MEEHNFTSYLLDKNNIINRSNDLNNQWNITNNNWKIRLSEEDFSIWLKNCKRPSLFFDGASTSNPGVAGAGGIICNEEGNIISSFEWGLGALSNNRSEALALLQGILQLQKLGINNAMIFDDSTIIISIMVHKRLASNVVLQQTTSRCQLLIENMQGVNFYHILRTLNKEANLRANRACHRTIGVLSYNEVDLQIHLP